MIRICIPLLFALTLGAAAPPELILTGGRVWTGEARQPRAQAVAIAGGRIVAVGDNRALLRLKGPDTQVVDLGGRMLVPGFIDAHTHFETATLWFFEARVIDVDEPAMLVARVAEAADRVPDDYWILGHDWGALTARRRWSDGDKGYTAAEPSLSAIDAVSGGHPVLLIRHDGAAFANSEALRRLRLVPERPDPKGGTMGRDRTTGQLTGMLYGTAAGIAIGALPPRSMRQTMVAARALMDQFSRNGITGIHDIARVDALSQATAFRTNVERSHSDLGIFTRLRDEGALSVRVNPILTLRDFAGLAGLGITPGSGDEFIHFGALKGFIDGNMTDEPWRTAPAYSGDFTFRVTDEATMRADIIAADAAGFDIAMHAFASRAHRLMLDWYEAAAATNGPRERRFRLIHAWYPAAADIARAARFGAVAEITPMHMLDDHAAAERMLTPRALETAFAWRTLANAGVRINIVSDWPGANDRSELSPLSPIENIYYAVTRHKIDTPASTAWRPEQGLTIEEALRAYTVNPAWSSHQESELGSIAPGKRADLVLLSKDILRGPPEELLTTRVEWTLLGGRTVFGRPPVPTRR